MVNTVGDDNTLAGLARQRIKGKPFTVTEYEHPSPNYHGAESPLLLAAYAGLQDWDGLWLFAYGQGNSVEPMGYVAGFFEIAQHPTKMANLLLAANLFRRGDVQPAAQEISMALTPDREVDLLQHASGRGTFSAAASWACRPDWLSPTASHQRWHQCTGSERFAAAPTGYGPGQRHGRIALGRQPGQPGPGHDGYRAHQSTGRVL